MIPLDGKVGGGLAHKVVVGVCSQWKLGGARKFVKLARPVKPAPTTTTRGGSVKPRALRLSTRQPSHVKVNADLIYRSHNIVEIESCIGQPHFAYSSGKLR